MIGSVALGAIDRMRPFVYDTSLLAAIAVVVAIALIVMAFVIRRDARAALRLAARSPKWPHATKSPARIRLAPVDGVAWEDVEAVEAPSQILRDLGFADAGTFAIEALGGLCLRGFVRPQEGLRAMVAERGWQDVFVEMIARYEDGRKLVLTNRRKSGDLEWPPGSSVEHHPGLDARGLYARMRVARPAGLPTVVGAEGFAADYERGYAELRDWRNLRGGLDEREIRSIAAAKGKEPDDDWVAAAVEAEGVRAAMGLSEAAFHRFFAEADLDDLTRFRLSRRIVIVHDRLSIEAIAEVFRLTVAEADWKLVAVAQAGLHDDELDRPAPLAAWPPRRAFVALNDLLPRRRRFRKVGEFAEPIATDLYAPPGV